MARYPTELTPSQQPLQKSSLAPAPPSSLDYAGFEQVDTAGRIKRVKVTQHVQAMHGTFGARPITVFHGAEVEAGTTNATFDADIAALPSATRIGTDVTLLKASSAAGGITQTTVYGAGNGVFDELPEVPQARWNNSAARSVRLKDTPAGSSLDDTFHRDGSYDEVSVPVEGRNASLQSYADGSGLYEWPFDGASLNSTITFSPQQQGKLNVLFVNAALRVTDLIRLKAWYERPPLLAMDSFHDVGSAAVPGSCGVPERFGQATNVIDESAVRLDFVFGEYETLHRLRYISANYGLLCFIAVDRLQTYYDYGALALSATPITTSTTTETLGLQTTTLTKDDRREEAALPLDVHIATAESNQRLKTARAILQALAHLTERS